MGASATTAATIGTVASTIGTISTIGSIITGVNSAKAEAKAAAGAANYNAQISEQNAAIAKKQTEQDVKDRQRAAYLSRSENINNSGNVAGNALDILSDNAAQSELDILNTKYQGLLTQNSYLNSAALDRSNATNAKTMGKVGAASALLGGVSDLYKPSQSIKVWTPTDEAVVKATKKK